MSEVVVIIGAGSIGQAIARRLSAETHVRLADLHKGNADTAASAVTAVTTLRGIIEDG